MNLKRTPRFGVVGWKNTGKTTLVCRLVKELTARGYRVATVKHAHVNFDIDHEHTDSHAHREAGATEVAIVSPRRWAIMHENTEAEPEASLDQMIERLSPCDLVMIEGFKGATHQKIEIRKADAGQAPWLCEIDSKIVALAFDQRNQPTAPRPLPAFARDEIAAIADLIVETCHLGGNQQQAAE